MQSSFYTSTPAFGFILGRFNRLPEAWTGIFPIWKSETGS